MALYQNGILISGANTLPQMTLAEYQALPVSERPTYWERTDLNYTEIPDVFYKDIPIAGVQISNYYATVNTGVDSSEYTCIGINDVAGGGWDENTIFRVATSNALKILSMRTASYTIANNAPPIRMYFVKKGRVNATPLT